MAQANVSDLSKSPTGQYTANSLGLDNTTCSLVMYALASACTVCQGRDDFVSWSNWTEGCSAVHIPFVYYAPRCRCVSYLILTNKYSANLARFAYNESFLPNLANWPFLKTSVSIGSDGRWNITAAKANVGMLKHTLWRVGNLSIINFVFSSYFIFDYP